MNGTMDEREPSQPGVEQEHRSHDGEGGGELDGERDEAIDHDVLEGRGITGDAIDEVTDARVVVEPQGQALELRVKVATQTQHHALA